MNHVNTDNQGLTATERHWAEKESAPKPLVRWKDQLTGLWKGPDVLIASGRGYACVFPQDAESPIWVPDRLIRPGKGNGHPSPTPKEAEPPDNAEPGQKDQGDSPRAKNKITPDADVDTA